MSELQAETITETASISPASRRGRLWQFLFTPVDIASIVFFRVIFGMIMLWHVAKYFQNDGIAFYYIKPQFHLTFYGFEWVRPWPGDWMYVHFAVMGLAALCVLLGCCYRVAAVVLFLTFTQQFLIEKSLYQNHYYLMSLISFLMIFIPAHRACSVDALFRPSIESASIPAWTIWLLRVQLGIVYFYGGLAKLNGDWLRGWPMRIWLGRHIDFPLLGSYVHDEWCVMFFSYGGLIFDLLIVPLLLWRPTRIPAVLIALFFHLMNANLFNIGVFPWFMIGATMIYFPPSWPRTLLHKLLQIPGKVPVPLALSAGFSPSRGQRWTAALLGVYVTLQMIIPFRQFLYPGSAIWTEEGHFFAWQMMLREKNVGIRFYAHDPTTGKQGVIGVKPYISERQMRRLGKDPEMILDFVHYLHGKMLALGHEEVEIRVLALASLNGRKPQLLVDPEVDLAKVPRTLFHQNFILPLNEPLQDKAWDVPLLQWEQHPDLKRHFEERMQVTANEQ